MWRGKREEKRNGILRDFLFYTEIKEINHIEYQCQTGKKINWEKDFNKQIFWTLLEIRKIIHIRKWQITEK